MRSVQRWCLLGLVCALLVSSPAWAVELDAKVEFMGEPTLEGAEMNLGSVVTGGYRIHSEVPGEGEEEGPITLVPELSTPLVRYELGLTAGRFRWGLSHLGFEGEASAGGSLPGYWADLSGFADPWQNRYWGADESYDFPSLWGMDADDYWGRGPFGRYEDTYVFQHRRVLDGCVYKDVYPLVDVSASWDPAAIGVTWNAAQNVDLSSLYGTAEYRLVDSDRSKFALVGGLHKVDWKERVDQSLSGSLHEEWDDIFLKPDAPITGFDSSDIERRSDSEHDKTVAIATGAEVDYEPVGVAVGLKGEWKLGERLRFGASVVQSYLNGDAVFKGEGSDREYETISTTTTLYPDYGSPIVTTTSAEHLMEVNHTLPSTERSIDLNATEARATLSFDFTENIYASLAYHHSRWDGIPRAPRWNYAAPSSTEAVADQWTLTETSDLELSGWTLGLGVRF